MPDFPADVRVAVSLSHAGSWSGLEVARPRWPTIPSAHPQPDFPLPSKGSIFRGGREAADACALALRANLAGGSAVPPSRLWLTFPHLRWESGWAWLFFQCRLSILAFFSVPCFQLKPPS